MAHLSLVTLGVADLARAAAFYEALGFARAGRAFEGVAFFRAGAVALSLYPRAALAEDAQVPVGGSGFGGVTLACNQPSREAVDAFVARAAAAGGRVTKPPQDVFWGGYSGYFADLDGHPWEVAWNPHFPLDADGRVTLPV